MAGCLAGIEGARTGSEMADAIRTNREEESHRVSGFSLMEPVGKVSSQWKRLRSFLHDVRVEMKQVNWPSRQDVISTTIVVTVTVTFFGIFFYITDSLASRGIGWLINYVRH
jgi:preprotein translocase subunit SecE